MSRRIAIGDIHNCFDELLELLGKLNLTKEDTVISVGDLLDRGPHPLEVIRYLRVVLPQICNVKVIQGNHDEKCVRWFRHEKKRKETGKKNPMPVHPDRQAEWSLLHEEDVAWIAALPVVLDLGDWLVVHGGFENKPFEKQHPGSMLRCRYIDPVSGEMATRGHGEQPWTGPEGSVYWSTLWTGKSTVYGHAVHSLSKPRVDRNGSTECWGIDTGCVFGGRLTAMILDTREIIQVNARKMYWKPFNELNP